MKRDRTGAARYECTVEQGGFRYRDTLHRSLSAAASAAAADLGINARVNGFVFWGLMKTARLTTDPDDYVRKVAARHEERVAALLKQDGPAEVGASIRRELETHTAHLSDLLAKSAA